MIESERYARLSGSGNERGGSVWRDQKENGPGDPGPFFKEMPSQRSAMMPAAMEAAATISRRRHEAAAVATNRRQPPPIPKELGP